MDYQFIFEGTVNLEKMTKEIKLLANIDGLSRYDNKVIVHSYETLSSEVLSQIESTINNHTYVDPYQQVLMVIDNARKFGYDIIQEFATNNVLNGITQANKTKDVALYLHKLEHFLTTGSLYAAIGEMDIILADENKAHLEPYVTNEIINEYRTRILSYLQS